MGDGRWRARFRAVTRLLPPPWLLAAALAINAALLACSYLPAVRPLQGDERYYLQVGTRIAEGRPLPPSPFTPPLYGELLGQVISAFGPARLPIQTMQIAMWLAAGILLYRIALRIAPLPGAAQVTAALFFLSLDLMAFTHFLWSEIVHLFFMVAAAWLIVCHARPIGAAVAAGILMGCALLTKLLLYPVAWLVPAAYAGATMLPWRARVVRAALFAAAIAFTIVPTMRANRERHGAFMIADSGTLNLWLGLHPGPNHSRLMQEFLAAGPDMPARNAVYRERIRREVRRRGLWAIVRQQVSRQYFQLLHYESWFTRRLVRSRALPARRGQYQLRSPMLVAALHLHAHAMHALLLAATAFGIAALRPRSAGWWNVVAGFLLYNLAIFLVVNVNPRYFVQMMPAAMLLAGVGGRWLIALARGTVPPASRAFAFSRARLAVAIVLAVALEYVAFRDAPVLGL